MRKPLRILVAASVLVPISDVGAQLPAASARSATPLPALAQDITQQAYLKASNTGWGDGFGTAVAVYGDTAVVGAPDEDSAATGVNGSQGDGSFRSGAVYVFSRSGTIWSQQAYLKASNTDALDTFGSAVAIWDDTIVVGAPVEESAATGVDGDESDNSAAGAGAAYVFVRDGTTWSQQAYLKASNTGSLDFFGTSVAVEGDTVVVGAPWEDSGATGVDGDQSDNGANRAGAAYVFARDGTTWSQDAYLKASNTDPGDEFGVSVSVWRETVLVGAWGEDSHTNDVNGNQDNDAADAAGAAYVFVRHGTTWSQEAYLKASNSGPSDVFGQSVSISGDVAIAGARGEDSFANGVNGNQLNNLAEQAGAAYVYARSGTAWEQEAYLKASASRPDDLFGCSVAAFRDFVVVGAFGEQSVATGVDGDEDADHHVEAGAAYVFRGGAGTWEQVAYLKASNTGELDRFGWSVAVSEDEVLVGAPCERSAATGVNGDEGDDSLTAAGAAYSFDLDAHLGERVCSPAVPNSTGHPGSVSVLGSDVVADDDLTLIARDLPSESNIGYFIMGQGSSTFTPPGSAGPICIAPGILRYLPPVENTTELQGGFAREVGTSGPISGLITPGSTWSFQAWHRDGTQPSNLTDAARVVFQ